MDTITPCLWFDSEAEEAARFYTSLFERSRIVRVTHYSEGGPRPAGTVLTVDFELDGRSFTALNGGPQFPFTEAISLQVLCRTQEEVDRYWSALTAGGQESQCGWLKDRYGVSWQVVPTTVVDLLTSSDGDVASRVMAAMMPMRKLDIETLEKAAAGS